MSSLTEQPGGDYNVLPYVSMPIAYSQPAHLAAMARLHGLDAPAADTATVLEIGAASGGNIIPLAARFPRARFVGNDLSVTHVEIGRRRIAELGLTNIEMRQGDIADGGFGRERFDYIICHGVYSWVPPAVREGILRLCRETLSQTGIAAVSYNVLPGWHLRSTVRDICLLHAGTTGTPRERVARVREILLQLADTVGDDVYGRLLKAEAARIVRRPGSYILGELLSEHNAPCHVRDFIGAANRHGLAYLSEADLHASMPELLAPAAAARISTLAGADALAVQQYVDIFSGRTFRRSLLVRAGRAPEPPVATRLHGLHGLHVACDPRRLAPATGKPADPAVQSIIGRLGAHYPSTVAVADLIADQQQTGSGPGRDPAQVLSAVFGIIGSNHATVSTVALAAGTASDRPTAWNVARADAASRQPWVTSLSHLPVLVDPVGAELLAAMNGLNDRAALARHLLEAVRAGRMAPPDLRRPEAAGPDGDMAAQAVALTTRAIARFESQALLLPAD